MMGQLYGAQHSTPAQARDPGGPRDPSRTGPDRRQFDAMAALLEVGADFTFESFAKLQCFLENDLRNQAKPSLESTMTMLTSSLYPQKPHTLLLPVDVVSPISRAI